MGRGGDRENQKGGGSTPLLYRILPLLNPSGVEGGLAFDAIHRDAKGGRRTRQKDLWGEGKKAIRKKGGRGVAESVSFPMTAKTEFCIKSSGES